MLTATDRYVALLRGINVGTANQVSMPALIDAFTRLGFTEITTILRSGNVVFTAPQNPEPDAVEAAVLAATGVQAGVIILARDEMLEIARANPVGAASDGLGAAADGSRTFVTFVRTMPRQVAVPDAATLAPETLTLGQSAIYQWMPAGSQATRVPKAFWAQFGDTVTTRNANTVEKIVRLLG